LISGEAERLDKIPTQTNACIDGSTIEDRSSAHQANPATGSFTCHTSIELMERVVCRENLLAAWARVKRNRGAAGIDDMHVVDLMPYCREHWPRIKKLLVSGHYRRKQLNGLLFLSLLVVNVF